MSYILHFCCIFSNFLDFIFALRCKYWIVVSETRIGKLLVSQFTIVILLLIICIHQLHETNRDKTSLCCYNNGSFSILFCSSFCYLLFSKIYFKTSLITDFKAREIYFLHLLRERERYLSVVVN